MDSDDPHNGSQNPPPAGGKGDALRQYNETRLEYRAVANGWLKNENGLGLDAERLARVASRNVEIALNSSDPRAVTASTRNVVAMVGQVMEQEKRDGGGENINVNLGGKVEITDDERVRRVRGLAERIRRRRLGAAHANGTGGVGPVEPT